MFRRWIARCTYIRIKDPDGPSSELWASFIDKMKESILMSFDAHVTQLEEDTRRLDMQRHMPGWNYCTFFILKARIVAMQSFQKPENVTETCAAGRTSSSIWNNDTVRGCVDPVWWTGGLIFPSSTRSVYIERAVFVIIGLFNIRTDKALAWFGHFGATDPMDDSGNILDFKRKDYRDLINKNSISVFDFRCYLFARQCRMLLKMQRVIEVCIRSQLFISSFIPSIRENEVLPRRISINMDGNS